MNKKNKLSVLAALVIAGSLTVTLVAFMGGNPAAFGADGTTYTLTLDETNGPLGQKSGYSSGVNTSAVTSGGNAFSVTYANAILATGYYTQLKASSGSLYSTNGVKGLASITVTYDSETSLSLYTSDSATFSGSASTIASGSTVSVSQDYFKLACGSKYAKISSIVLTYTCTSSSPASSSTSSSASSSSSSTSSSSSSSTPISSSSSSEASTYSLVTSSDQLVSNSKYVIANSGSAGSAYFCGNSAKSTDYRSAVSGTIASDLTMTPTSTIDEFTLGGSEGAWTFYSTKASTKGYLSANTSGSNLPLVSAASSSVSIIWSISVGSAGALTIKNAGLTKNRYLQFNSTYSDFTTSTTSAKVYLFVEGASVLAPALSLNTSSLSFNRGAAAGTITATTDSGASLSAVNSSDGVATIALSGNLITVTPVAAGTTTITVKATKDGYSRSAKCVVTVYEPSLALSNSALTVVGLGVIDNSIVVTASNFAGTPTYTVISSEGDIATGEVSDGTLSVLSGAAGTTTLTVKAFCGEITKTASVAVTVYEQASITSVSVSGTSSVAVGKNVTLTATVSSIGSIATTVNWTSSAPAIASVNAAGLVTGVSVGNAVITATSTADSSKSGSLTVTVTATAQDAWTIMIYMCGADLESNSQTSASGASGYATGDLKEIYDTRASLPDNVNVIVEAGGAKSWKSTYSSVISTSYLNRFHLTTSGYVKDAQITKASMGVASTFQSFLEWGLTSYPADRTMVVLWDHGGAMHGCCYDELYSDDSLLNSEVKTALSGAFTSMGRTSKLECIGYDACLMQVQDVAEFNSAYFNYMVGSEESEAGAGWDYDGGWLTSIYNNPSTITTPTLLTSVADTFITDNGGVSGSSSGSTDQTLSWLDLSKMSAYKSSWESMASYLSSNVVTSSNASSFRSLLKGCKRYAVDSDNSQDYFGTIDAKDFLDKLLASSTFNKGSVSTYVAAVSSAFSALVGYSTCQTGAGNSNGLCCFFSLSSDSSQSVYYAASQTNFSNWRSLSSTYGL
jgi:hypothetical protein